MQSCIFVLSSSMTYYHHTCIPGHTSPSLEIVDNCNFPSMRIQYEHLKMSYGYSRVGLRVARNVVRKLIKSQTNLNSGKIALFILELRASAIRQNLFYLCLEHSFFSFYWIFMRHNICDKIWIPARSDYWLWSYLPFGAKKTPYLTLSRANLLSLNWNLQIT